jgi:DNA polymerase sigma
VRKEREGAISIIEGIVKKNYNEFNQNNQYNMSNNSFVGVKMYGSMASGLAIDSSDVDLSVTGIDFKGNRESLICEMRSLYE